jgi:hypothetical protein
LVFGTSDGVGDGGTGAGDGGTITPPTGDETLDDLVAEATTAFENANAALAQGDLAGYQRWIDEAERLVIEIEALVNQSTDASALHVG